MAAIAPRPTKEQHARLKQVAKSRGIGLNSLLVVNDARSVHR
jgi:hypothetical protein